MLRSSRSGDRDDSILAKHPGKRNLSGSRLVLFRDMPNDRMQKQPSLLDRRVGHDWNVSLATPRHQIKLDAAPCQVVQHLISGNVRTALYLEKFDHVAYVEIADSPISNPFR